MSDATLTLTPDFASMFAGFLREIDSRTSPRAFSTYTDEEINTVHSLLGPLAIAAGCMATVSEIGQFRAALEAALENVNREHERRDAGDEDEGQQYTDDDLMPPPEEDTP